MACTVSSQNSYAPLCSSQMKEQSDEYVHSRSTVPITSHRVFAEMHSGTLLNM